MTWTTTIHPCTKARQREAAHHVARLLPTLGCKTLNELATVLADKRVAKHGVAVKLHDAAVELVHGHHNLMTIAPPCAS